MSPRRLRADGAAPPSFVGARLWLDFVNTDPATAGATRSRSYGGKRADVLDDFASFLGWLQAAGALEADRAAGILRRAEQQPAGAGAALADARRVRVALRTLAERGGSSGSSPAALADRARLDAAGEINRILGRSTGTRRLDVRSDGRFARSFAPVGDAFAGLMIPVVDSAADAFVAGELARVRRCAGARCGRVFYDTTKNGRRRWCDMATCGNRAKAARHRAAVRAAVRRDGLQPTRPAPTDDTNAGRAGDMNAAPTRPPPRAEPRA